MRIKWLWILVLPCIFLLGLTMWFFMEKKQITLPIPTGAFPVGTITYQLVDTSRKEKYSHDAGHPFRELMMQIWYPAQSQGSESPAPYISSRLKSHIQEVLAQKALILFGGAGYIDADVATHEFYNLPVNNTQVQYPVILFSHGFGCPRFLYTSLYEELASHGYIVVAVNHTYTSEPTEFKDGRILRAANQEWSQFIHDTDAMEKAHDAEMATWVEDLQFVLDQLMIINNNPANSLHDKLDLNNVGVIGHSFGGSVATALCRIDERCKAGVDMEGPLFGPDQDVGFDKPFMFLFGKPVEIAEDAPNKEYYDELLKQNERRMSKLYNALTAEAYYFVVTGADHMSFSDWNLITQADKVDALKKIQITRTLLVNFFDKYLKYMQRSVLDGINPEDIVAKELKE